MPGRITMHLSVGSIQGPRGDLTSTVREALEFSALLRQPTEYSREERLAYVDHVIDLLDMQKYADAVVGIPGSGLNVERKSSFFSAK